MTPASLSAAIPLMAFAALLSAALTWSSIHYATRARLIDEPGRRRSHSVPTPRGGGVAIVATIASCVGVPLALRSPAHLFVIAALLLVALVGWIDDHRPLSARLRFLAHWASVPLLFAPLLVESAFWPDAASGGWWGCAAAFALVGFVIVWSINLHNFMDGIDGLLAMQALFCLGLFAWLLAQAGEAAPAAAAAISAAAVLGFLPFNFPRARIFMGDVGSGALGLAVALAAIAFAGHGWNAASTAAVVVSAFVTDATCTLLSRMLRGRRWYSAHREHLYQWLVRSGYSHAQVVALYLIWNLLLVLPVVCWMNRPSVPSIAPTTATAVAAGIYALATAVWWFGKRWCLGAARTRRRHAAA